MWTLMYVCRRLWSWRPLRLVAATALAADESRCPHAMSRTVKTAAATLCSTGPGGAGCISCWLVNHGLRGWDPWLGPGLDLGAGCWHQLQDGRRDSPANMPMLSSQFTDGDM